MDTKGAIMKKSQSDPGKFPSDGSAYEYPVDRCDHLVSTSLRDLGLKYQNLSPEPAEATDPQKKDLA